MEHRLRARQLRLLRRLKERISMKAKPLVIALTVTFIFGIALIDPFLPLGLTVGILYAIPVALIALWSSSTQSKLVVITATTCTMLISLNLFIAPPEAFQHDLLNRLLTLIAIWGIVIVSLMRKRRQQEIKTLRGLLSICSYCKRVRDSHDNWTPLERFISAHTEADFSHGICPDCFPKHFPESTGKLEQTTREQPRTYTGAPSR